MSCRESSRSASSGVRQYAEQLQAAGRLARGFAVGGAFQCSSASRLPIRDRLRVQAGLGVVVGEEFGLGLDCLRKLGFQSGGDALVVLLAGALQQRLIRRILYEGVLEAVGRLWRCPVFVEKLGCDKLVESLLQGRVIPRRNRL